MRRVLIIGATSSIAQNIAQLEQARGSQLYLLARSEHKLAEIAARLGPCVVGSEALDFDEVTQNAPAIQNAFAQLKTVDLVLIAHGYLGDQIKREEDLDEALHITQTNYISVVSQLLAVTACLKQQGTGHIAAISSVAGLRGRPRNYTYGAAKSALSTYLQGVRSRHYPHIHITNILLGPVDTPMSEEHKKNGLFLTSNDAARRIVRAIDQRKNDVFVPGFFRGIMWIVVNLPEALFQRFPSLSGR
jgi:short-subunit dehydrogenase